MTDEPPKIIPGSRGRRTFIPGEVAAGAPARKPDPTLPELAEAVRELAQVVAGMDRRITAIEDRFGLNGEPEPIPESDAGC